MCGSEDAPFERGILRLSYKHLRQSQDAEDAMQPLVEPESSAGELNMGFVEEEVPDLSHPLAEPIEMQELLSSSHNVDMMVHAAEQAMDAWV